MPQGSEDFDLAEGPDKTVEMEVFEDVVIRGPGTYRACYFEHCTFDTSTDVLIMVDCYFARCWNIPPEMVATRCVFSDTAPTFWDRLMDESFHRCIK